MTYKKAKARLNEMGPVFTVADFEKRWSEMTGDEVRVWLSRQSKAGLIVPAGPKAGIYYNVHRYPQAQHQFFADVIMMVAAGH